MKFLLSLLFFTIHCIIFTSNSKYAIKETNYIDVYILPTVKFCLQLIPLSQGNLFLMVGSLEVMHELIFTVPSVIQINSVSSINSIRVRFNLGNLDCFFGH